MKITNVHIGHTLLIGVLALMLGYVIPLSWVAASADNPEAGMVAFFSIILAVGILGFYIGNLLTGGIEFELYVPNPIRDYRDALREKRRLAETLRELYVRMADAEGPELDKLIRKINVLREKVEQ